MRKVSFEIWKQIPSTVQRADLKLALTQKVAVKAATAVVHSTQLILKASRCEKLQQSDRDTVKQLITHGFPDSIRPCVH